MALITDAWQFNHKDRRDNTSLSLTVFMSKLQSVSSPRRQAMQNQIMFPIYIFRLFIYMVYISNIKSYAVKGAKREKTNTNVKISLKTCVRTCILQGGCINTYTTFLEYINTMFILKVTAILNSLFIYNVQVRGLRAKKVLLYLYTLRPVSHSPTHFALTLRYCLKIYHVPNIFVYDFYV